MPFKIDNVVEKKSECLDIGSKSEVVILPVSAVNSVSEFADYVNKLILKNGPLVSVTRCDDAGNNFDNANSERREAPQKLKLRFSSSRVALEGVTSKHPAFPSRLSDLDCFAEHILSYGAELSSDHPGFKDPEYRARRAEIAACASSYRTGQSVPRIQYTPLEITTWKHVFEKLTAVYPQYACKEHRDAFAALQSECGYSASSIPQLEDVSKFLKSRTGFTLRPVTGLLSSRDFLNGLAFRVFHSTQYMRHHSCPDYTPEPDVCHELMGHVPLFADPDFAAFSHELGLASLGATDEEIKRLSTIYWFTVEFGLCREVNPDGKTEVRAYGAGLLSSFGELQYSCSEKPEHRVFEAEVAATQEYPITSFQPLYFVAESFRDAKHRVRAYATHCLRRSFAVHYDARTETILVLDSKSEVMKLAENLKSDVSRLTEAIQSLRAI